MVLKLQCFKLISCSDSRVIPEAIFSCGIGELFTIRVAGNVIDESVLGSIEYAAAHLHCPLIVVLGHTRCGAVAAAISGEADGFIKNITDLISSVIGAEKDDREASRFNVNGTANAIKSAFHSFIELRDIRITGALYDTETGCVDFFNEI